MNGTSTTRSIVNTWLNLSGHLAQMKYTSAECCAARWYTNVCVYTAAIDGTYIPAILYVNGNYYYNITAIKAFEKKYQYFVYVGLM